MLEFRIVITAALTVVFFGFGPALTAQKPDSSATQKPGSSATEEPDRSAASQEQPALSFGVSGGGASFRSGSSSQAVAVMLQYAPLHWFTLYTDPGFAHATDSTGRFSTSGVTDLPVGAGVWHTFPGPWSPSLGVSLGVTLPVGDTATGFGNGSASFGGSLGVSASPTESFHVSLGVGRGLSGLSSGSAFAAGSTTSVSAEASVDFGERARAGLSFGEDLGSAAAEPLERVIGGGLSYALADPLTMTLDASHGFGAGSAKWVVSLGVGTAFAGISPVSPTTVLRRLRSVFGGNGVGSSKSAKGASSSSCRSRRCRP